ncbi:MAG TPA: tRNA lysidine(34) synthetase TilS [Candidatus Omnitrophota bacterium]|nr:tRNA lysidine(34) synthetase TilS [Candidatus Omnitrophota bacterium]
MLTRKVLQAVKEYGLIREFDRIVLGVSGGPDSIALLYCLLALKEEYRLTLHIAHLNHMLRPKDSLKDAEFVRLLAKKLGLACAIKKVNVRGLKKGSLEEAARKARLDFFLDTAKRIKADKIALGHTLDDQAETVLMRLLRGSGLLGLSGILPKRDILGFTVIRPLLGIKRKEIENFLKAKRIIPRVDASNLDQAYFRNRIRHKLLPGLEKYNPNIKEVLAGSAQNLALDYDYLCSSSLKIFKRLAKGTAHQRISFPLDKFLKLHPAIGNMLLRYAYAWLKGDTRRLTYRHIRELNDLLLNRPEGSIVDLPSGISFSKRSKYLIGFLR